MMQRVQERDGSGQGSSEQLHSYGLGRLGSEHPEAALPEETEALFSSLSLSVISQVSTMKVVFHNNFVI